MCGEIIFIMEAQEEMRDAREQMKGFVLFLFFFFFLSRERREGCLIAVIFFPCLLIFD